VGTRFIDCDSITTAPDSSQEKTTFLNSVNTATSNNLLSLSDALEQSLDGNNSLLAGSSVNDTNSTCKINFLSHAADPIKTSTANSAQNAPKAATNLQVNGNKSESEDPQNITTTKTRENTQEKELIYRLSLDLPESIYEKLMYAKSAPRRRLQVR
jgi:hypothetical protein